MQRAGLFDISLWHTWYLLATLIASGSHDLCPPNTWVTVQLGTCGNLGQGAQWIAIRLLLLFSPEAPVFCISLTSFSVGRCSVPLTATSQTEIQFTDLNPTLYVTEPRGKRAINLLSRVAMFNWLAIKNFSWLKHCPYKLMRAFFLKIQVLTKNCYLASTFLRTESPFSPNQEGRALPR